MLRREILTSISLALLATLAFSSDGLAHPVSYKGSIVAITQNSSDYSRFHLGYSLTHRFLVGATYYRSVYFDTEAEFAFPTLHYLLKRWNGESSQANLYLGLHAGLLRLRQESRFFWGGFIQADYETREVFVAIKFEFQRSGDQLQMDAVHLKGGFAPFVASYEDLNIWLLAHATYRDFRDEKYAIGPVLRFFYRNVFWELGANNRGNLMINTMVHF